MFKENQMSRDDSNMEDNNHDNESVAINIEVNRADASDCNSSNAEVAATYEMGVDESTSLYADTESKKNHKSHAAKRSVDSFVRPKISLSRISNKKIEQTDNQPKQPMNPTIEELAKSEKKVNTKRRLMKSRKKINSERKKVRRHSTDMTEKKQRAKRQSIFANKQLVYSLCGLVIIVAVGVVSWTLISKLNQGVSEESTFASNDAQTTISLDAGNKEDGSEKHTRVVYQYDGDNVVGQKTYFEYSSPEEAKKAFETLKDQPEFKGGEVVDNYIVVTADPNMFKGLTADDIRQQAEAIEQFQNSHRKTEAKPEAEAPTEEEHAEGEESAEAEKGPEE